MSKITLKIERPQVPLEPLGLECSRPHPRPHLVSQLLARVPLVALDRTHKALRLSLRALSAASARQITRSQVLVLVRLRSEASGKTISSNSSSLRRVRLVALARTTNSSSSNNNNRDRLAPVCSAALVRTTMLINQNPSVPLVRRAQLAQLDLVEPQHSGRTINSSQIRPGRRRIYSANLRTKTRPSRARHSSVGLVSLADDHYLQC